jgi:hypothetical protein
MFRRRNILYVIMYASSMLGGVGVGAAARRSAFPSFISDV